MMRADPKKNEPMLLVLAKAALIGVLLSIVLLLIFSFTLDKGWLQMQNTRMATIIIKVLSALCASTLAVLRYKGRALVIGVVSGISYAGLAIVFFSILSEEFSFSPALLGDLGIGALSGAAAAFFLKMLRA